MKIYKEDERLTIDGLGTLTLSSNESCVSIDISVPDVNVCNHTIVHVSGKWDLTKFLFRVWWTYMKTKVLYGTDRH